MWYKVLKVRKNASRKKIEKAYQKLSADPNVMYDVNKSVELRKAYNEGLAQLPDSEMSKIQNSSYKPNDSNASNDVMYDITDRVNSALDALNVSTTSKISEERKQELRDKYKSRRTTSNKVAGIIIIVFIIIAYVIPMILNIFSSIVDSFNTPDETYSTAEVETSQTNETQTDTQLDELDKDEMLSGCLLNEYNNDYNYDYIAEAIEDNGYTTHNYRNVLRSTSKLVEIFWYDEIDSPSEREKNILIGTKDTVVNGEEHQYIFYFNNVTKRCRLALYDAFDSNHRGEDVYFIRYMETDISDYNSKISYQYYIASQEDGKLLENIGFGDATTSAAYSSDVYNFELKVLYENEVFYNEISETHADLQYQALINEYNELSSSKD